MEAYLFCPSCQADNTPDRLHCRVCGASLEGVSPSGPLQLDAGGERPEIQCLRCGIPLELEGYQRLQRANLELKDGVFAAELRLEMHACPRCGHVELFKPEVGEAHRWPSDAEAS